MKLSEETREKLIKHREDQEKLLSVYMTEKNNEMAYLVRWSILEKVVKDVAIEYRKFVLKRDLEEWLSYLNASDNKKPNVVPKFTLESFSLPIREEFIKALNTFGIKGEDVWKIMASKGDHRESRNRLAHSCKKFNDHSKYEQLMSDLEELTKNVFKQIESSESSTNTNRGGPRTKKTDVT